jgi:hypothetical protein
MAQIGKGRGSGRSSVAPPVRLRRSIPPSQGARPGSLPPAKVSERATTATVGDSLSKGRLSGPPVGPSQSLEEDKQVQAPSDLAIRDGEYGSSEPARAREEVQEESRSQALSETALENNKSPVPDDEHREVSGGDAKTDTEGPDTASQQAVASTTSSDESIAAATTEKDAASTSEGQNVPEEKDKESQPPNNVREDVTAGDFFKKDPVDSLLQADLAGSADEWQTEDDSILAKRASKRSKVTLSAIFVIVIIVMGGLYSYSSMPAPSRKSDKTHRGSNPTSPVVSPNNPSKAQETETAKNPEPNTAPGEEPKAKDVPTEASKEPSGPSGEPPAQDQANQGGLKPGFDREACCGSIAEYQEALRLNPNDTEILGKLAYFYLNKGMNPEAKRFAERTLNVDLKSSTGWIVLGAALDAMNDRKGAFEAYKKCADEGVGKYVTECRNLVARPTTTKPKAITTEPTAEPANAPLP